MIYLIVQDYTFSRVNLIKIDKNRKANDTTRDHRMDNSNPVSNLDNCDDHKSTEYEGLKHQHKRLNHCGKERQCPHCEAHLYPGTYYHKCCKTTETYREDYITILGNNIAKFKYYVDEKGQKYYYKMIFCNHDSCFINISYETFIECLKNS